MCWTSIKAACHNELDDHLGWARNVILRGLEVLISCQWFCGWCLLKLKSYDHFDGNYQWRVCLLHARLSISMSCCLPICWRYHISHVSKHFYMAHQPKPKGGSTPANWSRTWCGEEVTDLRNTFIWVLAEDLFKAEFKRTEIAGGMWGCFYCWCLTTINNGLILKTDEQQEQFIINSNDLNSKNNQNHKQDLRLIEPTVCCREWQVYILRKPSNTECDRIIDVAATAFTPTSACLVVTTGIHVWTILVCCFYEPW